MGFWGKKMLPQVFKWSDEEKSLLSGGLDEAAVLNAASGFIAGELDIESFTAYRAGKREDIGGRSSSAFPLRPGLTFE